MGPCSICGALVADALIHALWHDSLTPPQTPTIGDPDAV